MVPSARAAAAPRIRRWTNRTGSRCRIHAQRPAAPRAWHCTSTSRQGLPPRTPPLPMPVMPTPSPDRPMTVIMMMMMMLMMMQARPMIRPRILPTRPPTQSPLHGRIHHSLLPPTQATMMTRRHGGRPRAAIHRPPAPRPNRAAPWCCGSISAPRLRGAGAPQWRIPRAARAALTCQSQHVPQREPPQARARPWASPVPRPSEICSRFPPPRQWRRRRLGAAASAQRGWRKQYQANRMFNKGQHAGE
jgi:hypothetical protein